MRGTLTRTVLVSAPLSEVGFVNYIRCSFDVVEH
jgi:hypothetical protein